jgi:uroporphyrinogen decarboxylase
MFEHICGFALGILKNTLARCRVDTVELKEDMAYKGAPMIGPDMFRKFMLPHYREFVSTAKSCGVSFVFMDCDGYPGKLIPLWMEAGIDGMSPCEIAAGNDILGLRKAYPRFHLWGGIDKRVLSQGKAQVRAEVMSKVPEMIEKGGYIPHVDHAVPADAKLENYIYFRELLREIGTK